MENECQDRVRVLPGGIMKGFVHSLESFGSVDGPGIRYIIFLQGCAMRCQYCHNADTWKLKTGTEYEPEELLAKARRFKPYWGKDGGITVSGGEALLQIDFLLELFKLAKAEGINTCLDTSGNPFTRREPFLSKFEELMKYTDLLLLDLKHMDDDAHKKLTGHSNKNILDLAEYLSDIGKPVWIRHVLVPGVTSDDAHLTRMRAFIDGLSNVEKVEVLPYHTLGVFKWKELGIPYELEGVATPTREEIAHAEEILCSRS